MKKKKTHQKSKIHIKNSLKKEMTEFFLPFKNLIFSDFQKISISSFRKSKKI